MLSLSMRHVFGPAAARDLAGIRDFETIRSGTETWLYSGAIAGGEISAFRLDDGAAATRSGPWAVPGLGSDFTLTDLVAARVDGSDRLLAAEGSTHLAQSTPNAQGAPGDFVARSHPGAGADRLLAVETGGQVWLVSGAQDAPGLWTQGWDASGLSQARFTADSAALALGDVAALAGISQGGTEYVFSGSATENAVGAFRLTGGVLTPHDTLDASGNLWVSGISALETVGDHLVIAATGSSSLTLARIDAGRMTVTDHLVDSLGTRFAGVDALTAFTVSGRHFVAAGGSDDGVSLLEILPDGTFLAHDALAQDVGWTLAGITALEAAVLPGEVQIFAAGRVAGVTQLAVDTGALAAPLAGTPGNDTLTGSTAQDLIVGGDGNDRLYGMGGDDIVIGGPGQDRLWGGAGADMFVFHPDGAQDVVEDFQPGLDLLDVSRWGRIYDVSALIIVPLHDGARIDHGDQSLRLNAGQRLDAAALADSFVFDTGRTALPAAQPDPAAAPRDLSGGAGNDVLEGGPLGDILRGGEGDDILRGHDGADTLEGGDGADTLNGGDGDDVLFGGRSAADLRDVIFGGDGDDWIDGGYGNDLVYGGAGRDTIQGGFGADELIGQDGDDVLNGGPLSDLIFGGAGNDFINGGFGSDRVNGGAGADRFYHLGIADHGSDWIQNFSDAEGDLLLWGGAGATPDDFQVNYANTPNAGSPQVEEAFVIHRSSGQIVWALVDGGGQAGIDLRIGTETFDLLG